MAIYYTTVASVSQRFENTDALAHLTNQQNGVPLQALIEEKIQRAEGLMHSRLAKRSDTIPLPLDVTVAITASWARTMADDLAEVLIFRTADRVSEAKEKQYDECIAELNLIAEGKAEVPGVDPDAVDDPTPSVTYGVRDSDADVEDDILVFGRKTWSGT